MPPAESQRTGRRPRCEATARRLGARVLARRTALGLTQKEVHLRCGLQSNGHISLIENGHIAPSSTMILLLCRALEWTPNALLGWEEADGH